MGASLACCVGTEAVCCGVRMLSSCCKSGTSGKQSAKASKMVYLMIIIFSTVLALCLQKWGAPNFDLYSFNIGCDQIPHLSEGVCKGDAAVYRISMGTFLFFLLNVVGTLFECKVAQWLVGDRKSSSTCCLSEDHSLWTIRYLEREERRTEHLDTLLSPAYSPGFFLVLQIVAFIDFAYSWNDAWVNKAEEADASGDEGESGSKWLFFILGSCAVMLLVTVVALGMLYIYYGSCGLNVFFITWTAICIIGTTAAHSCHRKIPTDRSSRQPSWRCIRHTSAGHPYHRIQTSSATQVQREAITLHR